jgi:single-strand DNA-binding protein
LEATKAAQRRQIARRIVMSQGAEVTLVGFVATEPNFKLFKEDTLPYLDMRVGVAERRIDKDTGEWRDGDPQYYTVKCWRTLASNAAGSLRKGQPVVVKGKFRSNNYTDKEGRPQFKVEIEAETIGHDLNRGTTYFTRNSRPTRATEPDDVGYPADSADLESLAHDGMTEPDTGGSARDPGQVPEGEAFAGSSEMFDEQAIANLAPGLARPAEVPVPF